jgi:hypothetical protein
LPDIVSVQLDLHAHQTELHAVVHTYRMRFHRSHRVQRRGGERRTEEKEKKGKEKTERETEKKRRKKTKRKRRKKKTSE